MSIFQKAKKAKENKKGFTLVELIVVIVILAILAAIMVPSLVGYIDKTRDRNAQINGNNLFKAMQTHLSELYAQNLKVSWDAAGSTTEADKVFALAEMDKSKVGTAVAYYAATDDANKNIKKNEYKITCFEYKDGEGGKVMYYDPEKREWGDKKKKDGTDGSYPLKQ